MYSTVPEMYSRVSPLQIYKYATEDHTETEYAKMNRKTYIG